MSGATLAEAFRADATAIARELAVRLRDTLSLHEAMALPEASIQDIVVAGREAQLAIYRQADAPGLTGGILVTVQVARHALGGVLTFQCEQGVVFSSGVQPRDATEQELLQSRGSA